MKQFSDEGDIAKESEIVVILLTIKYFILGNQQSYSVKYESD